MKLLLTVLALWLATLPAQAASNNILLIIADDFGVPEASWYRSDLRRTTTRPAPPAPNLRALAAQGITFSRFWATPWCSPTRASVLTGQYGFRHGLGVPIDQSDPPFTYLLSTSAVTLPKVVGDSSRNYVMRHIGKFHLNTGTNSPISYGWTTWTGPNPGAGGPASSGTGSPDYFNWRKYTGDSSGSTNALTTTYATTDQVNEAVATIRSANSAGRPYFIWLAFNAPHSPFHAPPSSLHTRTLPGSPTDRQYYEAMVEAMDTEIGRLLDDVDLATTTVIFMGDNGTPTNIVQSPYQSSHGKGTIYQEGMRTPLVIAGQGVTGRGYVEAMVNCVDLFPTIVALAGQTGNSRLNGVKIDGISLIPYFTNPQRPALRNFAYAEEFPNTYNADWERVMRNTDFSLIERATGTTREFYNLRNDPLQTTNILSTPSPVEAANLATLNEAMDALLATR